MSKILIILLILAAAPAAGLRPDSRTAADCTIATASSTPTVQSVMIYDCHRVTGGVNLRIGISAAIDRALRRGKWNGTLFLEDSRSGNGLVVAISLDEEVTNPAFARWIYLPHHGQRATATLLAQADSSKLRAWLSPRPRPSR